MAGNGAFAILDANDVRELTQQVRGLTMVLVRLERLASLFGDKQDQHNAEVYRLIEHGFARRDDD